MEPKQLEGRGVRHLKRLVKDKARLTVTKIVTDLHASLPKLVTTRAVRDYLKELGLE